MKYRQFSLGVAALATLCSALNSAQVNAAHNKTEQSENLNKASNIETLTILGKANTEGAELGGINIKDLAINSHVVGLAEMERIKFVSPDEFLDRIPGETQVRNLRIPDGGKSYTVPMLDGIPIENPYEGATQRLDRVNTADIQQVQIIKGPASALYANNAFGGVVNVITKDAPKELETKVSLETGSFDRLRADVSTGGTVNDIGFFINANTRNIEGLRDEVVDDKDQFSGKLIYQLSDATKLTTRFEYIEENTVERRDLTAEQIKEDKTQAGDLSALTDLEQSTLAFSVDHLLNSGEIEFDLVRREKNTIGDSRFSDPQDEEDIGYNAKILYRHDFNEANLIGGYDLYSGKQKVKEYGSDDLALTGSFDFYTNELTINAYFIQYQKEVTDKLIITAGARYEDIYVGSSEQASNVTFEERSFSDLAPKLGITYQVSDNNMLWLGVSEGFYAPSASNLFDAEDGNAELKPEEATNIEIGFRGQWNDWHYDTSVYYNNITDYLVTQEFVRFNSLGAEEEFEVTNNAGKVNLKGLETVIEYAPKNQNWRLGFTHTFARAHYDSFVQSTVGADDDLTGKELRRTPKHHLNTRVAWLPTEQLTVELEADMYTSYFADNENSPQSTFMRDSRIHLRVNYDMEHWKFWLHGLNLTDTLEDRATYSRGVMSFRTINGRTFYAGASYEF